MTPIHTVPVFKNWSPCASYAGKSESISKFRHGGARANSGGVRAGAGRPVVAKPDFTERKSELRWYCARTYWHAEQTASRELRDAGFTVLSPSVWFPAVKAWRNANGATRPAVPDRVEPMFPRYVLVQFRRSVDDWKRIRRLPGVEYLFLADGNPIAMPDQAIELIRGLCDVNDCHYPDDFAAGEHGVEIALPVPAAPLEVGAAAQIIGPLADLRSVCTMSDGKRVELLMTFLGAPRKVTGAQDAVTKA